MEEKAYFATDSTHRIWHCTPQCETFGKSFFIYSAMILIGYLHSGSTYTANPHNTESTDLIGNNGRDFRCHKTTQSSAECVSES